MRVQRIALKPDLTSNTIDVDLSLLQPLIQKYKGKKGIAISLLQGAQDIYGYIPEIVFEDLSKGTGIELSILYGVATFYTQFRLKPVGKNIVKICHGTACHVQNATAVGEAVQEVLNVKDGETTSDSLFTLESVACLGCCSLAPVMMIGSDTYGNLDATKASKIIREYQKQETN